MIADRRASIIESRLRQRVLRSVDGVAAPGIEAASGSHREEREKSEGRNDPGKGVCFRSDKGGSCSSRTSATMAEFGARTQVSGA